MPGIYRHPPQPTQLGRYADGAYPTLIIPTGTPAAVGPNRSFKNPVVQLKNITFAGPVLGPRSIPSPLINLQQRLVPGALAGPRAIPSPKVGIIQTIRPSALAGPRAIPSPTVKGSTQFLRVNPIIGPRNVIAPTVNGGQDDCVLYVGGVRNDYLSWVDGAVTVDSQSLGRWRCQFALEVPGGIGQYQPQLGQVVLIVDRGKRLFAGCITDILIDRHMMTSTQITYRCTAVDKSGICDHRVVTGKTYASGTSVYTVIQDIVTNFLNGEGITTGGVPSDGSLGTLGAALPLNFAPVRQAFDQIASLSGTVWWIDAFGVLHFASFASFPAAPFNLTETSQNWRNLTLTQTTTDYYNKLYAVSNLNILPGSGAGGGGGAGAGNTESFTWTPDTNGIQTITNQSGIRVATAIICSTPIGAVSSLTVNGVAQTVVDFGSYNGQSANPPDLLWFFAGPATGSPAQFVSPTVLPSGGDAIVIKYTPASALGGSLAQYGTALNPINPQGASLGTCGSGVYEGVIQVKDISKQADLNAIALAELNRIGGIPNIVDYETDFPGLAPGQTQNINIPAAGAANLTCLITEVSGRYIPPTLNHGGSFRWTVKARTNLDPGNWVKWYERLIARTANPLPVLQYEEAVFILGSGSSLSGGTSLTNPYLVGRTGLLVELMIAAATPPTGQNLTVQLTRNGSAIASINLPASTPANQLIDFPIPSSNNIYLFAQDVLNINATYSAIGGAITKAANVTFKVRWSM